MTRELNFLDYEGQSIFAYSLDELPLLLKYLGEPSFRAKQLIEWLYKRFANSYDEMLNLPKSLREKLQAFAPLVRAELVLEKVADDGTRKYLIRFADGELVESVGLPSSGAQGEQRLSACVSSQVGCAMACSFCETGRGGFSRNLLPGEFAEQIRIIAESFGQRVSHVVVMGQGEAFANYDASIAGLRILNNKDCFNIGARHITISTSGIIRGIERLAVEPEQFTLAVSLHSAIQETRDALMPGLKNQTLAELARAIRYYFEKSGRRPSLEYALIEGHSSSEDEIVALASFARNLKAHVNLIPINPSPSDSIDLRPPSKRRIREIQAILNKAGVESNVRKSRGADIAAACGQLLSLEKKSLT